MLHDGNYDNIREILGGLVGAKVVDITQHDKDEWEETQAGYISFHFDTGATITLPTTSSGFDYTEGTDGDQEGR